ncbi:hypothetical protein PWKp7_00013 [Klebsiella phage PWKp7]|nr:hypothetical protein PWKp1_00011 [Klebsiella phage PWKp1]UJD04653.1 hypothetical protein PWKp2_00014 [Klebsiella phage PWKp2]UJD04735.1 hypothetical protein PWKp3_00043 [Klebsiella phage PWKp3]UJD04959.1 hypothetical protein PWKp7_00013 [Klebsiella phage PWKp7]UJD05044.1 hypothetical protein PWKp9B_00044 [Klebsiella phage PWKp9B]
MSKFKVGDKVVRAIVGRKDEDFLRMLGEAAYYTVTSVPPEGYWLQVNGVSKMYDEHPWAACNFELYQEPEDEELPPVPDSVAYMNAKRNRGNDQRLVLEKDNGDGEGLMYIGVIPRKGSTRAQEEIGINIDPDSALQLAHDLRRMAMAVKRKEKAQ